MGRGSGTMIKYGKIEIVTEASIDDVMKKLDELLDKHGYPESDDGTAGDERLKNLQSDADPMESDFEDELSEADATDLDEIDDLDDEDDEDTEEEPSSPWIRAKKTMEDQHDTGKETPK